MSLGRAEASSPGTLGWGHWRGPYHPKKGPPFAHPAIRMSRVSTRNKTAQKKEQTNVRHPESRGELKRLPSNVFSNYLDIRPFMFNNYGNGAAHQTGKR